MSDGHKYSLTDLSVDDLCLIHEALEAHFHMRAVLPGLLEYDGEEAFQLRLADLRDRVDAQVNERIDEDAEKPA